MAGSSRGVMMALVLAAALLTSCSRMDQRQAAGSGGDPERGHRAIERFGCGACHVIPGVEGARARIGPSLEGIGSRARLAGQLPNNADNLVRWIRKPQEVKPGNLMPDLGIGDRDARDIAAYLSTLR